MENKQILIVEDQKSIQQRIKYDIENNYNGAQVICVASSSDLADILDVSSFDAIILDHNIIGGHTNHFLQQLSATNKKKVILNSNLNASWISILKTHYKITPEDLGVAEISSIKYKVLDRLSRVLSANDTIDQ